VHPQGTILAKHIGELLHHVLLVDSRLLDVQVDEVCCRVRVKLQGKEAHQELEQSVPVEVQQTEEGRWDSDIPRGGCSGDEVVHLVEGRRVLAHRSAAQQDEMSSDVILLEILASQLAKHELDELKQSNVSLM
jgi:hypothetical protein